MPRGDKSSYTNKHKRRAEHIEDSYEDRGVSRKEADRRAWATVNKESHGGKRSGSGRGKKRNPRPFAQRRPERWRRLSETVSRSTLSFGEESREDS